MVLLVNGAEPTDDIAPALLRHGVVKTTLTQQSAQVLEVDLLFGEQRGVGHAHVAEGLLELHEGDNTRRLGPEAARDLAAPMVRAEHVGRDRVPLRNNVTELGAGVRGRGGSGEMRMMRMKEVSVMIDSVRTACSGPRASNR